MKNSSKFLASQPSKGLGKIVPGKDGLNIAQGFMEVVRARQQYLQIKEEELTKRTAIQKKQKLILLKYEKNRSCCAIIL